MVKALLNSAISVSVNGKLYSFNKMITVMFLKGALF